MRKAAFIVAVILVASAVNPVSAKSLGDEQRGLISSNCASIKMQLKTLQKVDAKNRVHLGAQFESISTNLMMNLNLRLVKNNMANATIAEQQTTFMSERERFKNDYIGYSQELEALIDIDCKNEPDKFYEKLKSTRQKRADVSASVARLREIIGKHRRSVLDLRQEPANE